MTGRVVVYDCTNYYKCVYDWNVTMFGGYIIIDFIDKAVKCRASSMKVARVTR